MEKVTYSTNEICLLCGVSRKQLRYYEERGILSPVPRTALNNYRYYTQDHICEILATKTLRDLEIPLSEMSDIIYGKDMDSIRQSLWKQVGAAQESMEASLRRYQQSIAIHSKMMEAFTFLQLQQNGVPIEMEYKVISRPAQEVVMLPYATTFEDETYEDINYLPRIQAIAEEVNSGPFGELIYLTYDHFDSTQCSFNNDIHDYKIAMTVADQKKPNPHYDTIPPFQGVSAIHIGSPKNKRLHLTYMGLLQWAKQQQYQLANWSVEEWLIGPLTTCNDHFWVIQIFLPFKA